MGCATSKQPVCRNCQAPCSPITRRYSMHSHHFVAVTSTTLGSLKLDSVDPNHHNNEEEDRASMKDDDKRYGGDDDNVHDKRSKEFSMGLVEAKTWSKMINEKIPKIVPKTPITTPPGEPEMIDAWELMEGLEDTSPLRPDHHLRSFSFHVGSNSIPFPSPYDLPRSKPQEDGDGESSSNSNATSIISEFDPDVISTFRKALEELPPVSPFHLKKFDSEKQQPAIADSVRPLEVADVKKVDFTERGKNRVVLYFTSLRGVRKTYEDCCHCRDILKGIGVRVDERDVSMNSGFKVELKELFGDGLSSSGGGLPRVFVGKNYIGGAEEIRRMHEEGKLEKLLDCCEMVDDGGGVCEACGDVRFVVCEKCSGSCKIYSEGDYGEECEESDYGFRRCPDCNENGIVRCPICCD